MYQDVQWSHSLYRTRWHPLVWKFSAPLTHMHTKPPVCTGLAVKGHSKKAAEKFLQYYLNHILWNLSIYDSMILLQVQRVTSAWTASCLPYSISKTNKMELISFMTSLFCSCSAFPTWAQNLSTSSNENMLWSYGNCMFSIQGIQTRKMAVGNCCKQQASLFSSYVVSCCIALQTMLWRTNLPCQPDNASIFPALLYPFNDQW